MVVDLKTAAFLHLRHHGKLAHRDLALETLEKHRLQRIEDGRYIDEARVQPATMRTGPSPPVVVARLVASEHKPARVQYLALEIQPKHQLFEALQGFSRLFFMASRHILRVPIRIRREALLLSPHFA